MGSWSGRGVLVSALMVLSLVVMLPTSVRCEGNEPLTLSLPTFRMPFIPSVHHRSVVEWGGMSLGRPQPLPTPTVGGVAEGGRASGGWEEWCDSLSMGWVTVAAVFLPGSGQIINRDYWKLPIFYGGMAGFSVGAVLADRKMRSIQGAGYTGDGHLEWVHRWEQQRMLRDACIMGAVASYAVSVADALWSRTPGFQNPTAALFASLLLPGLGQVYNKGYWKIPVIYAGFAFCGYYFMDHQKQYDRYTRAIVAMLDEDPATVDEFGGKRPVAELEALAEQHRRQRDLNLFALVAVYALNAIDAYVDAHLFYWSVDDDVTIRSSPQVSWLEGSYAPAASWRLAVNF